MVLKRGSFLGMATDIINRNSKIVIFGAGVVGCTVTPAILRQYDLIDRIECYIDNDELRWKTKIRICNRNITIFNPLAIDSLEGDITVLITISRFYSAYEQLKAMKKNDRYCCYIIPAMCLENFHSDGGKGVIRNARNSIIPKVIHYMWLGGNPMPDKLIRCIDSWKKYCPDYEIVRWDESNYDVHKNKFVSQAYDNKKYGFVPDYARLELLYEYGGIYLDTDVELKRNIDELLYQEAFCSVEKWQVLNFGGCSGAIKGHKSLEPFLENWRNRTLVRFDGSLDTISSGLIDTTVALEMGYLINGLNQTINGMNIYTYDYFHPYDYMSGMLEMTNDTFSVHQFSGGWLDEKTKNDSMKVLEQYKNLMSCAEQVYDNGFSYPKETSDIQEPNPNARHS